MELLNWINTINKCKEVVRQNPPKWNYGSGLQDIKDAEATPRQLQIMNHNPLTK